MGLTSFVVATLAAENLDGAVGEHLVGVHVVRGACARLIDIHDEVLLPVARQRCAEMVTPVLAKDLVARLDDRVGDTRIEPPSVAVGHRGGALDEHRGADERWMRAHPTDRIVLDCPLGLRAVERLCRHFHWSERVFFDTDIFRRLIGIWHNAMRLLERRCSWIECGGSNTQILPPEAYVARLVREADALIEGKSAVYAPCWLMMLKSRA